MSTQQVIINCPNCQRTLTLQLIGGQLQNSYGGRCKNCESSFVLEQIEED